MSSVFSVSSVCLAYNERMRNVLAIRSHTLKKFKHIQTNNLASTCNNVHRHNHRMRNVHDVCLAYPKTNICACERVIIRYYMYLYNICGIFINI